MTDFPALQQKQQEAQRSVPQQEAQRALRFMKKRRQRKNYRWLCALLGWEKP